jgi:hypothetical protein
MLDMKHSLTAIPPWTFSKTALVLCCVALVSCTAAFWNSDGKGQSVFQIWPESDFSRNEIYGDILAFNIVPGSNYIVEVSHKSGPRPANSTKHASFDTLLIALPDKSCLMPGAKSELDSKCGRVHYSEFTGRYAISGDTNATAKAVVTVLSATKNTAKLHIECLIPCIWYDPLHPANGETATFEKTIDITAVFSIVDKHELRLPQSPIVTWAE